MRNLHGLIAVIFLVATLAGCTSQKGADEATAMAATSGAAAVAESADSAFAEPRYGQPVEAGTAMYPGPGNYRKALFAGGCFWCMEPPFDKVDGVIATVSGYTAGPQKNPAYKQVASGLTGHTEAVLVIYDPAKVDYDKLLDAFWRSHDPTDAGGQFVDRGKQYRPGIFPYDDEQRAAAQKSRDALQDSGRFDKPLALEISDASTFWPAEDYHQDFYKKDPSHYKRYRSGSGRDQFIAKVWGDAAR